MPRYSLTKPIEEILQQAVSLSLKSLKSGVKQVKIKIKDCKPRHLQQADPNQAWEYLYLSDWHLMTLDYNLSQTAELCNVYLDQQHAHIFVVTLTQEYLVLHVD